MKFEINKTYSTRSICDQDCQWQYKAIKRTAKTVTIQDLSTGEIKNCRIKILDGVEMIYPLGKYSIAPTLRANKY